MDGTGLLSNPSFEERGQLTAPERPVADDQNVAHLPPKCDVVPTL
jgi:hypothetical protein